VPPSAVRGRRVARYLLTAVTAVTALTALIALALSVVGAPADGPSAATADAIGPAVAGSLGLRLVDVPATARDDPRARMYIVDALRPGTVIHRRIEVSSTTDSTAYVALYAAAATIAEGSFAGAAGRTPNELSTWTSVRPGGTDLRAGGRATATVTIAVPRDAAPGERYGVVWAEVRSSVADDGLVQVSRVGIRLYVLVGAGGPPATNFVIDSLTAARSPDGRPLVLAAVHNTGGRALDLTGTLRLLAGPGGVTAGPFPVSAGTTLGIGDRQSVGITLTSQLPAGPWDARITLRSGLLDRGARATIVFPAAGSAPPVTAAGGRPGWFYPALAGVLLLGAVAVVTVLGRRHRRRPSTGDPRSAAAAAPSASR
jgi:hypothetical protein